MATHDIARETWAAFFDDFSRARAGDPVTIESVAPQNDGPQTEASRLPLVSISLDEKGGGAPRIEILLGDDQARPVTHAIENPNRVFHKTAAGVMSDEVNQDEVIEITAPGHPPITYLRFAPRDAR